MIEVICNLMLIFLNGNKSHISNKGNNYEIIQFINNIIISYFVLREA